jgi:hypothetical protein
MLVALSAPSPSNDDDDDDACDDATSNTTDDDDDDDDVTTAVDTAATAASTTISSHPARTARAHPRPRRARHPTRAARDAVDDDHARTLTAIIVLDRRRRTPRSRSDAPRAASSCGAATTDHGPRGFRAYTLYPNH